MTLTERALRFPAHKCGLHLTHNQHRDYYESAVEYLRDNDIDPETKARCIATDEIWELQWHPDTPVGFYRAVAPTLEECLALALDIETRALAEREAP